MQQLGSIGIGLPIVIFLGITYVFSGYLQSNQIFGPHAIMGIPYNAVFLIYLLFLQKYGYIGLDDSKCYSILYTVLDTSTSCQAFGL